MLKKVIFVTLFACAMLLQGCSQLGYYSQSIGGQLDIWERQQPVKQLIATTRDKDLKRKLQRAAAIRDFASQKLALPENDSYRKYADMQRDYVVWNVFATPEFSTQAKNWCFLVVGCVSYRGYFHRADAEQFADSLRKQGMDVAVFGVSAYSTLGYFNDPLLNTFLNYPDAELAALIFHELAHQVVYIDDDTTFNESFATAVQDVGAQRWLQQQGKPQAFAAYMTEKQRDAQVVDLLLSYRKRLQQLYDRQDMTVADKRRQKKELFAAMKHDYETRKQDWPGYHHYDGLFARPLNNAVLAPIGTYFNLVPAFKQLLANLHDDFPAFYKEVKRIGALPKKQRDRVLQDMLKQN